MVNIVIVIGKKNKHSTNIRDGMQGGLQDRMADNNRLIVHRNPSFSSDIKEMA